MMWLFHQVYRVDLGEKSKVLYCIFLFFLLFEGRAIRITPPLTINDKEIKIGCEIILEVLDDVKKSVH